MTQRGRGVAIVLCLTILVSVVAAAPTLAAQPTPSTHDIDHPNALQTDSSSPANNSSVRHEDPDGTNQDGDLQAVESHLARFLVGRIGESAIQLNEGEYERARGLLGDDFGEKYEQYVDVAGEVGTEGTAERLNETRETQREYAETVDRFNETYEQYRTAKENGNDARARRLAHRVAHLSRQANESAADLDRSYAELENRTGADLTDASGAIDETQSNVERTEREVTSEELIRTRLDVAADARSISFDDPLGLTGRLTSRNGTPVSNERITLRIRGRNLTTTTDDAGRFSLEYRPTTTPLDASNVTVQYVSGPSSVYLGTNATVPVRVSPVEGSLSITDAPDRAAFGDRVTVRGRLAVGDRAVPRYPLRVDLGNETLDTVRTDESGRFELTTTLPAGVADGTQRLGVTGAVRDRAIAVTPANRTMTVQSSPTALTLDGEPVDGSADRIRIDGTLRTESGEPLPDRSVAIRVNGSTIGTVSTDVNGSFRDAVRVPASALGDRGESTSVTVVAAFDGRGTSLESARARTDLTLAAADADENEPESVIDRIAGGAVGPPGLGDGPSVSVPFGPDWLSTVPWWAAAGTALVAVLLLGLAVRWYRRRGSSEAAAERAPVANASTDGTADDVEAGRSMLAAARDALAAGDTDEAVELAYRGVRQALGVEVGSSVGTHWEFVAACRAALSSSRSQSVRTLTEWYEQAAYGPDDVAESTAREAIDLASSVLESDDTADAPVTDGGSGADRRD